MPSPPLESGQFRPCETQPPAWQKWHPQTAHVPRRHGRRPAGPPPQSAEATMHDVQILEERIAETIDVARQGDAPHPFCEAARGRQVCCNREAQGACAMIRHQPHRRDLQPTVERPARQQNSRKARSRLITQISRSTFSTSALVTSHTLLWLKAGPASVSIHPKDPAVLRRATRSALRRATSCEAPHRLRTHYCPQACVEYLQISYGRDHRSRKPIHLGTRRLRGKRIAPAPDHIRRSTVATQSAIVLETDWR